MPPKNARSQFLMSGPLVSVIIPTYNRADVVCNAIESVLDQTYSNVEIIVVDDGSTDNTSSLLEKYGPAVQYLQKANGGVADARNLGLRHAKGEYIAYLDSDDVWEPNKLQRYIDIALARPADPILIFSDHTRVGRDGRTTRHADYYTKAREYFAKTTSLSSSFDRLALILEPYTFYPSTVLLSKSAHQSLTWRLFPKVNEDLFFVLEASRHCEFIYVDEPLTTYHVRDDSISAGVRSSHEWSEYAYQIIDLFQKQYRLSSHEKALCGDVLSKISTNLVKQNGQRGATRKMAKYLFRMLANPHTYSRAVAKALPGNNVNLTQKSQSTDQSKM